MSVLEKSPTNEHEKGDESSKGRDGAWGGRGPSVYRVRERKKFTVVISL